MNTPSSPQPDSLGFDEYLKAVLALPPVEPWPEPVSGAQLLDELRCTLSSFVVLPAWAPETMALWLSHTYAFAYRDITTYLGIESPEHRCGKSTLISVLSELAHRAVVASNVSAPSFFRVIAQVQPTLFIDEADTFLTGNDELKGILNSSYLRKTAFVLRAVNLPCQNTAPPPTNAAAAGSATAIAQTPTTAHPPALSNPAPAPPAPNYNPGILRFSCWCPKVIARIGSLPVTLADRCIVFRLHRKTPEEKCERLRKFKPGDLQRKCLRFALDHAATIASAQPEIPPELNDRAADIWEPLFVIADLAGGPWPELARNAARAIAANSSDSNPISVLLFDTYVQFSLANTDSLFSSSLVKRLNNYPNRPWKDLRRGKPIDERWLARQLSPYGIRPRNLRIDGIQAKGYCQEDMIDTIRRYVPKPEARALLDELRPASDEAPARNP